MVCAQELRSQQKCALHAQPPWTCYQRVLYLTMTTCMAIHGMCHVGERLVLACYTRTIIGNSLHETQQQPERWELGVQQVTNKQAPHANHVRRRMLSKHGGSQNYGVIRDLGRHELHSACVGKALLNAAQSCSTLVKFRLCQGRCATNAAQVELERQGGEAAVRSCDRRPGDAGFLAEGTRGWYRSFTSWPRHRRS